MKDLKDSIKNNREIFDDQEPSDGHMDRFEALLEKEFPIETEKKRPAKRIQFIKFASIAASIAIMAVIGIRFYQPNQLSSIGSKIENTENGVSAEEFASTKEYYQQQMDAQIADIMCKLANTDQENQAQLSADIERIMSNNKDFVQEISRSDNKELAIYYLVQHYQKNIETLENINQKLGKYTKC